MFKKIFNRISLVYKETISLLRSGWSLGYVIWNFIWWLSWSLKLQKLNKLATKKKTVYIEKHLYKHYSDIIENYRNAKESTQECSDFNIWIFWGQGKENMPNVVKACYKKITENNDNVQFIDMSNVGDFVEIPKIVYEKLKTGKLLYAHFSDIVRNSLLAKHGGLWLDATVYTSGKIPEMAKQYTFFSPHDKSNNTLWVSYAMGSNKINSVIFSFVRDILIAVCTKENVWPEYLLQDRIIGLAHKNIPSAKLSIDETPENNTRRVMLFGLMNKSYDENTYQNLIKDNFIFKLSYKANYKLTSEGHNTFYAQLIENILL